MKFAIVSCTSSNESDFKNLPLGKSISRLSKAIDFTTDIFYENTAGLSTRYNEAIDKHKDSVDALVFVHDDVFISDVFLDEKLEQGFKTYGILGVAGSSRFLLNEPIVWHNSPKDTWSGSVEHPMVNKGATGSTAQTYYWSSFGPAPKTCAVIDGLFIAADLKQIGKVRFQPEFDFHFYDLAFCMEAYFEKVKVGTSNIHLTHMSHGNYASGGWREMQEKFNKKYKK